MTKHNVADQKTSAEPLKPAMIRRRFVRLTRMQLAGIMLVAFMVVVSTANALYFTTQVANPVIRSDAWFIMDSFLGRQLEGSVRWTDYFIKRKASDVAGPLHKVVLTLNVRWFGDDFLYESLTGFVGMVLCGLYLLAVAAGAAGRRLKLSDACLIALIPLLLFSLNSVEIYNWSLVIWFFVGMPFGLLLFSVTDLPRAKWRTPAILFTSLICMLAMDIGGLLVSFAIVVALIFKAISSGGWRNALSRIWPIVAGVVVYHSTYAVIMPSFPPERGVRPIEILKYLIAHADETWKLVIIPAASSVIHPGNISWLGYPAITLGVALIVLLLHAFFWVSVFKTSPWRHATFIAVCLMVFVYSCTAGVVVGRVPTFGWDYLLQHRYVEYYQLANIALVLQWLSARNSGKEALPRWLPRALTTRRLRQILPAATLIIVAVLQLGLSTRAWRQAPFLRAYHNGMAQTLYCLAGRPELETAVCEPLHPVCGWRPEIRNRLVSLLKDHQLNVFSPQFQDRHGIYPDPIQKNRCVPLSERGDMVAAKTMEVKGVVDVRVVDDAQTGNRLVTGSVVGTGLREGDKVVINDKAVETVFGNSSWITFSLPLSTIGNQNTFTLYVVRESTSERSKPFTASFSRS